MTDQTTNLPLNLDDIEARAAGLYEYATGLDDAWQAEADQLTGTDVPALVDAVRHLRAVLDAEKSAHLFTLRQRNNRSKRLTHLHVEPSIELGTIERGHEHAAGACRAALVREPVADAIEHQHVRGRFRDGGFDRRRYVVNAF